MRHLNRYLPFLLTAALSVGVMGQDVLTKAEKQKTSAVVPYFGVAGGINLSNQWGPDVPGSRGIAVGVNGGVAVPMEFNDYFMLEPELQYTMRGTSWDTTESGENLTYSTTLQYLEIPVLAKLSVPTTGLVKPYIFLGASGGLRLAASKSVWGSGVHRLPHDISDSVSMVDASVIGGACTHVFVGNGYLLFEGRFTLGLWNVDRAGQLMRNWTVGVSVGYDWKLTKQKKLW